MSANHNLLDEPILRADQDALGRGDYANSVADLILTAPQGSSSQVIGLYGKWGEGKTSLKNMVLEAYKAQSELPPLVVEFSPWTYTSRERLPFLFFCEIAHILGDESTDESAEKLSGQFKTFGMILDVISNVPALNVFSSAVKPIVDYFGTTYSDQANDLSATRKQIHDLMQAEARRLIVVVDDLDRISAKEVRRMIQLVKANGDFPNITYLLLCDREYVGRALCTVVDGCTVEDGREYLEKIVTFGLDLPRIRPSDLRDFLVRLLMDVLERHNVKPEEFNPDFELSSSVFRLTHDLRDVKRLIGGFEFQLAMHRKKGGGKASVHLGDLIALEACRLFEPKFFHAIYSHKDTLLCEDATAYTRKESKLDNEWVKQNLISFISDQHQNVGKEFLQTHLGWQYSDYLTDSGYSRCDLKELRLQFRLGHPDCFERYFNLYSNPAEFSKADLQDFNESLGVQDSTVLFLRKLFDTGRLRDFLSAIEGSFEVTDHARQENFVAALAITAEFATDKLPDLHIMHGAKFGFTLTTHLHRCVRFFLERSVDSNDRSGILMRTFKSNNDTVVLPTSALATETGSREQKTSVTQLLNDSDYGELKQICAERIESLQSAGKLINHVGEKELRHMWLNIGDHTRVKSLLAADFESYPAVIHALLPFTGWSQTGSGTFFTINLDWLEEFADPTSIIALLSDQKGLPPTEEGIKNCLVFAVQAKLDKQPYDHNDQLRCVYKQAR